MSQLWRYKVVWIQRFNENAKEYVVVAQTFCSETGKWSKSVLSFPWQSRRVHLCRSSKPVARNGTVHWLLEGPLSLQIKGIISIHQFDKIGTSNTCTTKKFAISSTFLTAFAKDVGRLWKTCALKWSRSSCGCRSCFAKSRQACY